MSPKMFHTNTFCGKPKGLKYAQHPGSSLLILARTESGGCGGVAQNFESSNKPSPRTTFPKPTIRSCLYSCEGAGERYLRPDKLDQHYN